MTHRTVQAALALCVLLSCSRKPSGATPASSGSASAPPSALAAASSAAPAATASAPPASSAALAAQRAQHPAERVLFAWSTALDKHDVDALAALYAPRVYFYGQWKTAAQVLTLKRSALGKEPDYRQRIDDVRISKSDKGFVALFQKHSGVVFTATVEGRLTLEGAGEKFLIAEESDSVTDAHLRQPEPSSCSEAAFQIADSQPSINADRRRVAKEFPEANPGGITFEEDATHLSAAMGYFLPERFDTRWRIEVEHGVLTLTDAYTMEVFPLTAEQRARVRRACSGAGGNAGP